MVLMVPPGTGVVVDPSRIEVRRVGFGALPVVNSVLGRLGFDELVSSHLGEPDPRSVIAPARVIGVLVANLAVGRRPLYGLSAWAAGHAPGLLGLQAGEAAALNEGSRRDGCRAGRRGHRQIRGRR